MYSYINLCNKCTGSGFNQMPNIISDGDGNDNDNDDDDKNTHTHTNTHTNTNTVVESDTKD